MVERANEKASIRIRYGRTTHSCRPQRALSYLLITLQALGNSILEIFNTVDHLVTILELRVASLPAQVMAALTIASALGFVFDWCDWKIEQKGGSARFSSPGQEHIDSCSPIRYIEESTTAGHYLFSHDNKLPTLFSNRCHALGSLAGLHYKIALVCYLNDIKGVDDEHAFLTAYHAKQSTKLFQREYGKHSLILLYLEIAAYSSKRSSFFDAAAHLKN